MNGIGLLSDLKYEKKPLKLIMPDLDYEVDETALRESIQKNESIIKSIREPHQLEQLV